jgi:uncharacterized membrane protein YvbJ
MKRCTNCSFSALEDRHICPNCGAPLQDAPPPASLDQQQEEQILKKLRRQVYRVFLGEITVIAAISLLGLGFGLWKAYTRAVGKLEKIVVERVGHQFQDKNIASTARRRN